MLLTQLCMLKNDIIAIHQEFMVQMRTYDLFYCLQVSPSNSSEPNLILYSIVETGRNSCQWFKENNRSVDLQDTNTSAVKEHIYKTGHTVDWRLQQSLTIL